MRGSENSYNIWLHRFAKLVVGATFILIFIGGLVTSTGSGLAVPDWPTTYGHFMFSFPLSKMVGGILYEHGHRMIATVVGFLTVILTVWLWIKEPRRWVRWFGVGALLAVIVQGILGGVTVLFKLPTPVSVAHGSIAQTFFAMTIGLAIFTSKEWLSKEPRILDSGKPSLQTLTFMTTAVIFAQLILGAIMRHMGAGLAIPDFPLSFGKLIPPLVSQQIAINFLHRVGAVIVSIFILWTVIRILRVHKGQARFLGPALLLLGAIIIQIILAALTIWTKKAVIPTTAHVATGAFILGTSLFLSLRAYRFLAVEEHSTQDYILTGQATT
jgi:cytochrome c oxidase assembly protein subunit 15